MPDSLARQRPQAEQMMNDIFRRVGDLPPLPAVAAKVLEILKDPDADLTALVSIIEKDQALTAKVLRVSNSAYYGLVRRISTVKDAVVTLGFNNMRNQVLALSAYSLMQGPASGYALEAGSLWDHSLCTGLCAEHLADTLGYKSIKDEVFIGGLLHDIGKTILSYYVSARFSNILERVDQLGQTFVEAERELGFDHAEVGARVALRWNLPESLVSMIGDHHKPDLKSVNAAGCVLSMSQMPSPRCLESVSVSTPREAPPRRSCSADRPDRPRRPRRDGIYVRSGRPSRIHRNPLSMRPGARRPA